MERYFGPNEIDAEALERKAGLGTAAAGGQSRFRGPVPEQDRRGGKDELIEDPQHENMITIQILSLKLLLQKSELRKRSLSKLMFRFLHTMSSKQLK